MKATATRESGFRHTVKIRSHELAVDERTEVGGTDTGPEPLELLAASLASCTAVTMEMYAQRKGWDVGGVEVTCDYVPAERGCPTRFNLLMRFPDELSQEQVERLRIIAAEEAAALDVHGRIDAAVLVPLYVDDDALHAVFTKRRDNLRRHAGEISFPGGRQDEDESDLRVTALRESEEEIGLDAGDVELIGALQPTPTIATNYAVYPFVGLIEPGRTWHPSAAEVAEVLEFPLHRLRSGYARRRLLRRGVPFRTDVYCVDEHLIWGATARIVADLLERVPDDLQ